MKQKSTTASTTLRIYSILVIVVIVTTITFLHDQRVVLRSIQIISTTTETTEIVGTTITNDDASSPATIMAMTATTSTGGSTSSIIQNTTTTITITTNDSITNNEVIIALPQQRQKRIEDSTTTLNNNNNNNKEVFDYGNPTNLYPPLYHTALVPPAVNHTYDYKRNDDDQQQDQHEHDDVDFIIDIMSTGSETRKEYMLSQLSTWANHTSTSTSTTTSIVRNYWGYTEFNDIDSNCTQYLISKSSNYKENPLEMTNQHFGKCRNKNKHNKDKLKHDSKLIKYFRQVYGWGQRKKGIGWLCAQVRFGQSLGKVGMYYRKQLQQSIIEQRQQKLQQQQEARTTTTPTIIQHYQHVLNDEQLQYILPDYLLLVDDDTYINMELFTNHMKDMNSNLLNVVTVTTTGISSSSSATDSTTFNSMIPTKKTITHVPMAYGGCVEKAGKPNMREEWRACIGGFGTFLSKGSIARLIHPIFCDNANNNNNKPTTKNNDNDDDTTNNLYLDDDDDVKQFELNVCNRIQENILYERDVFQNGMTISDLAYELSKDVYNFCYHSDWIFAYIINYYYLSEQTSHTYEKLKQKEIQESQQQKQNNNKTVSYSHVGRFHDYFNSTKIKLENNDICHNIKPNQCTINHHICHYMTPTYMKSLTKQIMNNREKKKKKK